MLNFFTMMVYAHSVDLIILMFPCIQNLSIEWIKFNIIIFFHEFSLILSKFQHHFKLTLSVGGCRFHNSRIGVQFRNRLAFCKVNIALQTILSLRLCIAPAQD